MARELIVKLIGDSSSLERAFKRSSRSAKEFNGQMSKAERGVLAGTGAFSGLRSVAFASTSFLGGLTIAKTVKDSVNAASDLEEQMVKTNDVFGESGKAVEDWAKTTTTSFGLSEREALTLASTFGALFKPLGLIGPKAAQQSEALVQLGADLAAFYNTDVSDALQAIQSGLVGQVRPLRRYGVVLSAARVQQEALTETGKKNARQLTEQEKVLARITLIFRDSQVAQGNFAATQGDLAQQMKIAKARMDDLEVELGKGLIPALTSGVTAANQLAGSMGKLAHAIGDVRHVLKDQFGRLGFIFDSWAAPLRRAKQVLDAIGGSSKKAAAGVKAVAPPGLRGPTPEFTPPGLEGPLTQPVGPLRTAEQRNRFFDQMIGRDIFRAGLESLREQLVDLGKVAALLTKRIAITKDITRKLNLEDQLLQVNADRAQIRAELAQQLADRLQAQKEAAQRAAEAARAAAEATQFAVLGLGPTGEDLPPTLAALRKEFQHVSKAIKGTSVDTSSNRSLLNRIRKALDFSSLLPEVRTKIKELLDGINQAFDQGGKGFATKFKPASTKAILAAAGLDLTPDQIRRLRASLAQVGMGGTVPPGRTAAFAGAGAVVITGDVHVHGVQNPKEFETAMQKRAAARSHNRRGHR